MSVLREDRHAPPRARKVFLPVAPSFARKLNHPHQHHTLSAAALADDTLSIDSLADDRRYSDVPSLKNFAKIIKPANGNPNTNSRQVSKKSAASSSTHASLSSRIARNSSAGSNMEDFEVSAITKRSGPNPSSSNYYPTATNTSNTNPPASSAFTAVTRIESPSPSDYEFDLPSIPSFRFPGGLSHSNTSPNSHGKLPSNNLSTNILAETLNTPTEAHDRAKPLYSSRKYHQPDSVGSKVTRSSKNNSNLSSVPASFASKNNSNLTSTTTPASFGSNTNGKYTYTDRNRRRTRQTSTNQRTLTDLSVSSKRTISGIGMDGHSTAGSKGRKSSNTHSQRTMTDLSATQLSAKGDIDDSLGNISSAKMSHSRRRLTRPNPVRLSPGTHGVPSTSIPSSAAPSPSCRSLRKSLRRLIPLSRLRSNTTPASVTAENAQQTKVRNDGRRRTEVNYAPHRNNSNNHNIKDAAADQSNSMLSKLSLRSRKESQQADDGDEQSSSKRSLRRGGNGNNEKQLDGDSQPSLNSMPPKGRGLRYRSAGDYSTTVQVLLDRERSSTSTRSRLDSTAAAFEQRSYSPFEISPAPGHRRSNSGGNGTMKWVTCLPGTKAHRQSSNGNNSSSGNNQRRVDRAGTSASSGGATSVDSNGNTNTSNIAFRGGVEEPHSFAGFRQKPWYLVSEGSSVSSGEWDNGNGNGNSNAGGSGERKGTQSYSIGSGATSRANNNEANNGRANSSTAKKASRARYR